MGAKNLCGKTVPHPHRDNAYEVWETPNGQWRWFVLKKYQADDKKPGARWYTLVESPYTPNGEYGDSYAKDVMDNAILIKDNKPAVDNLASERQHFYLANGKCYLCEEL